MCECIIHDHLHVAVLLVVVVDLLLQPLLLMLCVVFGLAWKPPHQTECVLMSVWALMRLCPLSRQVRKGILCVSFLFVVFHDPVCHPVSSPVCRVFLDHVSSRPLGRLVSHPFQFQWV